MPVEAQACGRPVVALGRGGALETVIDGETGVLFAEPTAASLAAALERVARLRFDAARIRASRRAVLARAARRADAGGDRRDDRRAGRHTMVRRYNRLLVAFYVVTDALLAMLGVRARVRHPLRERAHPRDTGYPPIEQYLERAAVRRGADAARLSAPGRLPAAPRPLARRRLLRRAASAASSPSCFGVVSTLVRPGLLRVRRRQGTRRLPGVAARLGAVPRS